MSDASEAVFVNPVPLFDTVATMRPAAVLLGPPSVPTVDVSNGAASEIVGELLYRLGNCRTRVPSELDAACRTITIVALSTIDADTVDAE